MSIEKLEEEIKKLELKLSNQKRKQLLACISCGRKTQIGKLDLIIQHFYVRPSGCTDGDYWTEGENPDFYVKCPKCETKNRHYFGPTKDEESNKIAKFIGINRYNFNKIVKEYRQELHWK